MTGRASSRGSWFAILVGTALAVAAAAAEPARIAIIIDDLGQQHAAGVQALDLPGPVALSFLPNTPLAEVQATLAHQRGKEVLLHLPLEPSGHAKAYPTSITSGTDRAALREYFRASLDSVPFASGVNNHQGSLLTAMPQPMNWLMSEFALHPGLYFVDSRTTGASVAYRIAREHGVPAAERSVFLDSNRGEAAVRASLRELIDKARHNERALAIGHPYPETLKVLKEELPNLAREGVELVAPSELIARQSGYQGPPRPLRLIQAVTLAATNTAAPVLPAATSAGAH